MSFLTRLSERTMTPAVSIRPPSANKFANQSTAMLSLEPSLEITEIEMPVHRSANESPVSRGDPASPVQSDFTSSEPKLMRMADPSAPHIPAEPSRPDLTSKTTLLPLQEKVQAIKVADPTLRQDLGAQRLNELPAKTQQQPLNQTLDQSNLVTEIQMSTPAPSLFDHSVQGKSPARDTVISKSQPSIKAQGQSKEIIESVQPIFKPIQPAINPRPQPEQQPVKQPEPTNPAPVIRVTIGRLEVRAMLPAPAPTKPMPAPKTQPQLTLEDYLAGFRSTR
jgi:hypothetical protein